MCEFYSKVNNEIEMDIHMSSIMFLYIRNKIGGKKITENYLKFTFRYFFFFC